MLVVRFRGDDVSGLFKPAPRLTLSGLPEPGGGSGSRSPRVYFVWLAATFVSVGNSGRTGASMLVVRDAGLQHHVTLLMIVEF